MQHCATSLMTQQFSLSHSRNETFSVAPSEKQATSATRNRISRAIKGSREKRENKERTKREQERTKREQRENKERTTLFVSWIVGCVGPLRFLDVQAAG